MKINIVILTVYMILFVQVASLFKDDNEVYTCGSSDEGKKCGFLFGIEEICLDKVCTRTCKNKICRGLNYQCYNVTTKKEYSKFSVEENKTVTLAKDSNVGNFCKISLTLSHDQPMFKYSPLNTKGFLLATVSASEINDKDDAIQNLQASLKKTTDLIINIHKKFASNKEFQEFAEEAQEIKKQNEELEKKKIVQ